MTAAARDPLLFYATPAHRCSYLPEREAVTVFADPEHPKDARLHALLAVNGFRRSGAHLYRPECVGCDACVPVRVPVADFEPSRSQRRAWKANADLGVRARPPRFERAHFELYRAYLAARHPGGGMDDPTPTQYLDFLSCDWSETTFYEFRAGSACVAVAVVDHLIGALSAVYTFFDPREARRGLGVYAILWQIEHARRLGLNWLYLGYWIADSPKMAYKGTYLPQERLLAGAWQRVERRAPTPSDGCGSPAPERPRSAASPEGSR